MSAYRMNVQACCWLVCRLMYSAHSSAGDPNGMRGTCGLSKQGAGPHRHRRTTATREVFCSVSMVADPWRARGIRLNSVLFPELLRAKGLVVGIG